MMTTIKIYARAYLKYRKARKELHSLTDKDLLDIGISRWDIDDIARDTYEKELKESRAFFAQPAWSNQ